MQCRDVFSSAEAQTAPDDALPWLQALAARPVSVEELKRTKIGLAVAWAVCWKDVEWLEVIYKQVKLCNSISVGMHWDNSDIHGCGTVLRPVENPLCSLHSLSTLVPSLDPSPLLFHPGERLA